MGYFTETMALFEYAAIINEAGMDADTKSRIEKLQKEEAEKRKAILNDRSLSASEKAKRLRDIGKGSTELINNWNKEEKNRMHDYAVSKIKGGY